MTIKDVAAAAGVGVATVSRVLTGTGSVSAATRAKVLAAAKNLDYRPSALGRSLKTQRTGGIGLIIPNISDPFCADFTAGVLACAHGQGGQVLIDVSHDDPAIEAEIVERFAEQRVDGIIAMPVRGRPETWKSVASLGLGLVFAGRTVEELPGTATVLADEAGGVRSVVEYLVGLGHRRVAFLGGRPAESSTRREHESVFRATLEELGVAVEEELVVRARPTADSAYAAAASLFMRRPDLTAVVAASHQLGEAAVLASRELNLRIPADVSIAVVDDVPWSELCDPPLTVVSRPAQDMGYRACELLLRSPGTREGGRAQGRPVVLPTELVVRASCGPVTGSTRTARGR
ncbi:LacI family DNA-binding transcriptional regulator [Actinocorallia longicatena]|uniref:LacI family DNA-binding transcriptional regulator n=1 Tax=Actinocorallia longicatena TaxID=111803 RepID=UPI0031E1EE35